MANEFERGDVVRLKSGSPDMTVDKIDGDQVTCVWLDRNESKTTVFGAHLLEKKPQSRTIKKDFGHHQF